MIDLDRSHDPQHADRQSRGWLARSVRMLVWIVLNFVAGAAVSGLTLGIWKPHLNLSVGDAYTRTVTGDPAEADPDHSASEDVPPLARDVQITRAEDLFLSGAYEDAGKIYDALLNEPSEPVNSVLEYRRALCWEMVGDFDQALDLYRKLADTSSDPAMLACSRLGQARSWLAQSRFAQARSLLLTLILNSATHPDVAADAFHTLAQLTTVESFSASTDLTMDEAIVPAVPMPHPARLMKLLEADNSDLRPEATTTNVHIIDQFSPAPRDTRVGLRASAAPVVDVLDAVSERAKIEIVADPRTRGILKARSVDLNLSDMDLATALDGVLEPVGLTWHVSSGSIQIELNDEGVVGKSQDARAERAERYCREALASHPDHPLASGTQFALANIRFEQKTYDDATSVYQSVLRRSEDNYVNCRAWFNLAKARLLQEQFAQSQQAFFKVADMASGQSLQPVVYLYLGRLLLQDGQIDRAIRQLVRSQSLARDSKVRCRATIALASCYLLAGNPQAANMTLMGHRDVLKSSPAQGEAAFLAALARFRGTANSAERLRRGRTLVSAAAHVEPARFFSFAGYLLLAQAHEELGLPTQMRDVYREALRVAPRHVLRDRVTFELAQHLADNRDWSEATKLFQQLVEEGSSSWSRKARFALAEVALKQEQIEDCLHWCYELVEISMSRAEKLQLLKMMGQAYERQSEHLKAALCFAGLVPVPEDSEWPRAAGRTKAL